MASPRLALAHRHIIRQRHADALAERTRLRMGLSPPAPTESLKSEAANSARKPDIVLVAMLGKGDNIHLRAPIKEWMKTHTVHLQTPSLWMFHDLIEQGLRPYLRETRLHAQKRQLERERPRFPAGHPPPGAPVRRIGYNFPDVERAGGIAGAVFVTAGLPFPVGPIDFSLPVPVEWHRRARDLITGWATGGRPLLVYRPLTIRPEWDSSHRNCDPDAYAAILGAIRERFFVVSVADLVPGVEWIVGGEQSADVKLHQGELDDETMAGLFAEADLVMSPAGFGPVLAQAVGTPSVTVYGRRESYRTTEAAGAHLAPTLGIDPDQTCDCHSKAHQCRLGCRDERSPLKRITLGPAIERLTAFVDQHASKRKVPVALEAIPKVLIFGTVYEDNATRVELTDLWVSINRSLNPDCELLIIDSASPHRPSIADRHPGLRVVDFGNNVGHLSRRDPKTNLKGRDGWGRAFSRGLELADGYDYAVHIECDLLFRKPVMPIIKQMVAQKLDCASVTVTGGTRRKHPTWVETGLMFFRTAFVKEFSLIRKYDWANRREFPTPEVVLNRLIGPKIHMLPLSVMRVDHCDPGQITGKNVLSFDVDGVTHSHNDQEVYRAFAAAALSDVMQEKEREGPGTAEITRAPEPTATASGAPSAVGSPNGADAVLPVGQSLPVQPVESPLPLAAPLKLNFGCGNNKLPGWQNFDAELDIEKPLPFNDGIADFILAEHVVEHVDYYKAIEFFKECFRVLKPGGVMRIAVPSLERIYKHADEEYCKFVRKWAPSLSKRGAMHAILYAHGHKTAWTASLLEATVYFVGFDPRLYSPGYSEHPDLLNVEGHHWQIGPHNNGIETVVCEGVKS